MARETDYENFRIDEEGGAVTLTIDGTSRMNALNRTMTEELFELATVLGEDESVRCIALTGSGDAFCAGGDLGEFEIDDPAADFRRGASLFHDAVVQLRRCGTPVITGVNGAAVGAGFSLAVLGDIALMSEDAYLQYGYTGIGVTGDGGSTFYLPRLVGLREAKRIALLNDRIPPDEAAEIGLVTETVPADRFDDRLAELADRVASGPTQALERVTRLFDRSFDRSLEEQLAEETDRMAESSRTADYREGIAAFAEKRDPEFVGR